MVLPDSDGNSFPSHEPCEQVCNVSKYSLPKIQTDIWNLPSIFGPWISNRFPYISIIFHNFPYISIYFQIFPYISIYFHIFPYISIYVHFHQHLFFMVFPVSRWASRQLHGAVAHRIRLGTDGLTGEGLPRARYSLNLRNVNATGRCEKTKLPSGYD